MRLDDVTAAVGGVPYISPENARHLYESILDHRYTDLLELGFAHGVATCYMAAALDEMGEGHLTAVDLLSAREWQQPSVEDLLRRVGLSERVSVVREHTGYNWFLHREIRTQSAGGVCTPAYDFCIIDGPKNWTIDGAAFFLVDKLLRSGGMIVYDDVDWTHSKKAAHRTATDGINHEELSDEELTTAQIREVAELLVMQHPAYDDFTFTDTGWFTARKTGAGGPDPRTVRYNYVVRPRDYARRLVAMALKRDPVRGRR